jgi:hypothetical protein
MDCFVAFAPLRKRFAFVAGNDGVLSCVVPALSRDPRRSPSLIEYCWTTSAQHSVLWLWVPAPCAQLRTGPGRRCGDTVSRSRGAMRPRFAGNFRPSETEGAGNAGRLVRPQPRVRWQNVESTRVSQVTPRTSGIPHAMVYDLLRALPGDWAFLPPSPLRSLLLKNLTPASRRQDHTTSPSAFVPFV